MDEKVVLTLEVVREAGRGTKNQRQPLLAPVRASLSSVAAKNPETSRAGRDLLVFCWVSWKGSSMKQGVGIGVGRRCQLETARGRVGDASRVGGVCGGGYH